MGVEEREGGLTQGREVAPTAEPTARIAKKRGRKKGSRKGAAVVSSSKELEDLLHPSARGGRVGFASATLTNFLLLVLIIAVTFMAMEFARFNSRQGSTVMNAGVASEGIKTRDDNVQKEVSSNDTTSPSAEVGKASEGSAKTEAVSGVHEAPSTPAAQGDGAGPSVGGPLIKEEAVTLNQGGVEKKRAVKDRVSRKTKAGRFDAAAPYNSGGHLDLDSPAMRDYYRTKNFVLVPVARTGTYAGRGYEQKAAGPDDLPSSEAESETARRSDLSE